MLTGFGVPKYVGKNLGKSAGNLEKVPLECVCPLEKVLLLFGLVGEPQRHRTVISASVLNLRGTRAPNFFDNLAAVIEGLLGGFPSLVVADRNDSDLSRSSILEALSGTSLSTCPSYHAGRLVEVGAWAKQVR